MSEQQPNNPLHGLTLKAILEDIVERHGWPALAERIKIACFKNEPSIKSSLKFLRRTPWARTKVEQLYLRDQKELERKKLRNQRRAERRAVKATFEHEASQPPDQSDDLPDTDTSPPSSPDLPS